MSYKKIVFSVVGWMADYKGPTDDDPAPSGGGRFVKSNVGYEAWNFLNVKGRCNAFVTTLSNNGGINLARVEPNLAQSHVDGVLLIFLSRVPRDSHHKFRRALPYAIGEGFRVVGWYNNCTLYLKGRTIKRTVGTQRVDYEYNAVCSAEDARCVGELQRRNIGISLSGPGGIHRSRVRYPFNDNGAYDEHFRDPKSWVNVVLKYIESFDTPQSAKASVERLPDELSDPELYPEGAKQLVTVNAYERDYRAREKCVQHFGYKCQVCKFDFYQTYGDLGRRFIHVHHRNPLALLGTSHAVDPIKDLLPVCPNCHAMLHRGAQPLSVEALRSLLEAIREDDQGNHR